MQELQAIHLLTYIINVVVDTYVNPSVSVEVIVKLALNIYSYEGVPKIWVGDAWTYNHAISVREYN